MRPTRIRLALALPFALLALALSVLGCVGEQLRVAHALAIAGGAISAPARALEQAEGDRAIVAVHDRGGTRAEAEAALAAVEARWEPAFAALRLFLAADEAWLVALEAQQSGDFGQLLGAACGVVGALRPLAPALVVRLDGVLGVLCPAGGAP